MDEKTYKWIHLQSPTFFFVLNTLFSSAQFGPEELKVLCVHLLLSARPPFKPIPYYFLENLSIEVKKLGGCHTTYMHRCSNGGKRLCRGFFLELRLFSAVL